MGLNPLLTAIGVTTISSVFIEKLRLSRKVYGESALALFLSGSLAVAVVLIGLSHGFNTSLFNFLFGSIATVTTSRHLHSLHPWNCSFNNRHNII